jgi:hypothetical protein
VSWKRRRTTLAAGTGYPAWDPAPSSTPSARFAGGVGGGSLSPAREEQGHIQCVVRYRTSPERPTFWHAYAEVTGEREEQAAVVRYRTKEERFPPTRASSRAVSLYRDKLPPRARGHGVGPMPSPTDPPPSLILVAVPKATLLLNQAEYRQAIRRGKWWKRQLAHLKRTPEEPTPQDAPGPAIPEKPIAG